MWCRRCSAVFKRYHQFNCTKLALEDRSINHLWLFDYSSIRQYLLDAKYKSNFAHLKHIAALSAELLVFNDNLRNVEAVTYVPSSFSRINKRGFDQSSIIAKEFSKTLGKPLQALIKQSCEFHQTSSCRNQRLISPKYIISQKPTYSSYLLVDDVATTRASISKAAMSLNHVGVGEVVGFTIAHKYLEQSCSSIAH